VVTSKIVSKAEGRLVDVPPDGPDRDAVREAAMTAETARVVARRGATRIVQTHHGFVMAAAGIDASNVEASRLVLLPKDPDASARGLRAALRERYGLGVAVIISDTMGRTWRNGLTDVALGAAGLPALRDHRGEVDPYGNELQLTQIAVVDELAGAGELVKGKCDGVPVAVVRGYPAAADAPDGAGVTALIRDASQDLFALGTAEARAAGLRDAATLPDVPAGGAVDPAAVARAIAAVAEVVAPGTRFTLFDAVRPQIAAHPPADADPAALVRFGADLHRLRAALAAEGIASTPRPTADPARAATIVELAGPANSSPGQ